MHENFPISDHQLEEPSLEGGAPGPVPNTTHSQYLGVSTALSRVWKWAGRYKRDRSFSPGCKGSCVYLIPGFILPTLCISVCQIPIWVSQPPTPQISADCCFPCLEALTSDLVLNGSLLATAISACTEPASLYMPCLWGPFCVLLSFLPWLALIPCFPRVPSPLLLLRGATSQSGILCLWIPKLFWNHLPGKQPTEVLNALSQLLGASTVYLGMRMRNVQIFLKNKIMALI